MSASRREVIDSKEVRDYVLAFLSDHPVVACRWVRDDPPSLNDEYRHIYFTFCDPNPLAEDAEEHAHEAREEEIQAVFDALWAYLKPFTRYVMLTPPEHGTFKILVYEDGTFTEEALRKWKERPQVKKA